MDRNRASRLLDGAIDGNETLSRTATAGQGGPWSQARRINRCMADLSRDLLLGDHKASSAQKSLGTLTSSNGFPDAHHSAQSSGSRSIKMPQRTASFQPNQGAVHLRRLSSRSPSTQARVDVGRCCLRRGDLQGRACCSCMLGGWGSLAPEPPPASKQRFGHSWILGMELSTQPPRMPLGVAASPLQRRPQFLHECVVRGR
jgi:hypothetical protein